MDEDVFQTFGGLFGQFQIEPDTALGDVATAPSGFHLFDTPLGHPLADDGFPFGNEGGDAFFEFGPVPFVKDQLPIGGAGVRLDIQHQFGAVLDHHLVPAIALDHFQPVTTAKKVVAFTGDHLAGGLARLVFEGGLLFFDPAEFGDNGQAHVVIGDVQRHGHPDPAIRWVNGQMQVFDVLTDHLHLDIVDGEGGVIDIHPDF